jgi:hypothetical protein
MCKLLLWTCNNRAALLLPSSDSNLKIARSAAKYPNSAPTAARIFASMTAAAGRELFDMIVY